jgi:hypothetical protein
MLRCPIQQSEPFRTRAEKQFMWGELTVNYSDGTTGALFMGVHAAPYTALSKPGLDKSIVRPVKLMAKAPQNGAMSHANDLVFLCSSHAMG